MANVQIIEQNLLAAYNTLIDRRDKCTEVPTEVATAWAEAYHDAANVVAAALECSGINVITKKVREAA